MADITKLVKIEFSGTETVGDLNKQVKELSESMVELDKTADENTKSFIDLSKSVNNGVITSMDGASDSIEKTTEATKSLKLQYREAILEAQNAEFGSDKFLEATNRAGELKDRINDVNEEVGGLSGNPIENLTSQFGNLGRSISTLDFKKATTQLNSVGNTLKTINLGGIGNDAKEFGKVIGGGVVDAFKSLGRVILANPILLLASVIIAVGAAAFALKDKIEFLGDAFDFIGDILGAIVQGLTDFTDLLGVTSFAAEEKTQTIIDASQKEQKAIESRYDREIALAAAAGKDVKELELEKQKALKKTTDDQILALEELQKNQGELTDENKKKLEELRESSQNIQTEIDVIGIKIQTERDANAAKEQERRDKEAEEREKERQKKIDDYNKDINDVKKYLEDRRVAQLGAQERELALLDETYQENVKKARGNRELLKKLDKQYQIDKDEINNRYESERLGKLTDVEKSIEDLTKSSQDLQIQSINDGFNEKIKTVENYYNEELKLASGNPEKIAQLEAAKTALLEKIEKSRQTSVNNIIDEGKREREAKELDLQNRLNLAGLEGRELILEQRQQELDGISRFYDEQIRLAGDNAEMIKALEAAKNAELDRKNNEFRQKDLADEKAVQEQKLQAVASILGSIGSLVDTFAGKSEAAQRKAFNINKAVSASEAVIAGILSVQRALASPPGPPVTIPFGVAAGVAAAANVAKILATPFKGGSSGTPPPSVPAPQAPQSPLPAPPSPTFQPGQFLGIGQGGQAQNTPIIIENNISANGISETQNQINRIETRAQIIN